MSGEANPKLVEGRRAAGAYFSGRLKARNTQPALVLYSSEGNTYRLWGTPMVCETRSGLEQCA